MPQRLIVRRPARAPSLDLTEVAAAEYGDRDAGRRALAGIRTLFPRYRDRRRRTGWISTGTRSSTPPSRPASRMSRLRLVLRRAARPTPRSPWPGTTGRPRSRAIRASGLQWTFLRDNLYLDFFPAMVGADGMIHGPADDGRVAAVAQDDIADVAVAKLSATNPPILVRRYDLTGPEALTLFEVADQLAGATERVVGYIPETVEEAYRPGPTTAHPARRSTPG